MSGPAERVVFREEAASRKHVQLIAMGEIDETLLDALSGYIDRQRRRLHAKQSPDILALQRALDWLDQVSEEWA